MGSKVLSYRKRCFGLCAAIGIGLILLSCDPQPPDTPLEKAVIHAQVDNQPITPITERYLRRVLRTAATQNAVAVLVELDTPGGLMESTQGIVRDILSSPVPVIVYVSPPGARAASAGVFITMAAHVAAMAPATHIGAAHPVRIGTTPGSPEEEPSDTTEQESKPSAMDEKMENDAVAWVRSLAELRGRNADWAEATVRQSISDAEADALAAGAVDLIADNVETLLEQIDGRSVVLDDDTLSMATVGVPVVHLGMWWGERMLGILSSPNIAFLLLMLGFYGILFEFYSPGWGVGGTLGSVCLILGFFGLAMLPINVAGFALLMLALALFVAEAFITSFGALAAGGIICLIVGGLMLIDSPTGVFRISFGVLIPVALATAAITVFLVTQLIRAQTRPVHMGDSALTHEIAVVVQPFSPIDNGFAGTVRVHGELWKASGAEPFQIGDELQVTDRFGLELRVKRRTPRS